MEGVPLLVSGCKPLMAPPTASMSVLVKLVLVTASLKVKTMDSAPVKLCVVLPLARVTATVGGVVSAGTVLKGAVIRLLASAPSAFKLPALSLNLLLATLMLAVPLAFALGVKVAV